MQAAPAVQASRGRGAPSDRCPGALRLHEAADGLLARLRLPGGFADVRVLLGLAALSETFAAGRVELTSRANVQLRGIAAPDATALAGAVADLGLLPSRTHERVRNIVASPSAGLGGGPDLTELVRALDLGLCSRPALAGLSGRFLFGFDDGTGDIRALRPDVLVGASGAGRWWVEPGDIALASADVVPTMLVVAESFLAERAAQASDAWRVADLPDGGRAVGARTRIRLDRTGAAGAAPPAPPENLGAHAARGDGPPTFIELIAPLGRLSADELRVCARHAGPLGVRITPWRTVVIPAPVDPAALRRSIAETGLTDERWRGVSACAGRPGCARALADVQADATAAVTADVWIRPPAAGRRVHWSGCERRCGHPAGSYLDVLATPGGYVAAIAGAGLVTGPC